MKLKIAMKILTEILALVAVVPIITNTVFNAEKKIISKLFEEIVHALFS